jgi:YD repeat-containing protein
MSRIPCVKLLLVSLALFFVSFQYVSTSLAGTIQYQYDEMDRLHSVILENGQEIIYEYDEIGNIQSRTVAAPLIVGTTSLPPVMPGEFYSQTLAASGGEAPYTWTIFSNDGPLPEGFTLDASGVISGTPPIAGGGSFTVLVTDSVGNQARQSLAIAVIAPPVITTTSLPGGITGNFYSQALNAKGGAAPYTWSIYENSPLPAGLTLNAASGVISGTPTTAGNSNFIVQVSDINGFSSISATLTISVVFGNPITASAGANGTISPPGSTYVANNGSQTYTIVPAVGYAILNVLVDGASVGAGTSYTFSKVTASHTISATFGRGIITASAGANGSISPSGATVVPGNGSQTYTITPATGYFVANVLVDGVSVSGLTSYPFMNVTTNHTISATFSPINPATRVSLTFSPNGAYNVAGPTGGLTVSIPNGHDTGTTPSYNVTLPSQASNVLVTCYGGGGSADPGDTGWGGYSGDMVQSSTLTGILGTPLSLYVGQGANYQVSSAWPDAKYSSVPGYYLRFLGASSSIYPHGGALLMLAGGGDDAYDDNGGPVTYGPYDEYGWETGGIVTNGAGGAGGTSGSSTPTGGNGWITIAYDLVITTYGASPTYYCPSGGTLSGTTCTTTYGGTPTYYCPSGGTLSWTFCTISGSYAATLAPTSCYYPGDDPSNPVETCGVIEEGYIGDSSCVGGYYFSVDTDTPVGGQCEYSDWEDTGHETWWQPAFGTYTCPSGGNLSGTTCYTTSTYGASAQSYSCNSGDTLSGSTCYHYYTATVQSYSCTSGDTLSGSTCYHY